MSTLTGFHCISVTIVSQWALSFAIIFIVEIKASFIRQSNTKITMNREYLSIRTSTRSNCVIHYGCIDFVTHAQFGVRSGLMTARDPKMSHDTGKQ